MSVSGGLEVRQTKRQTKQMEEEKEKEKKKIEKATVGTES